MAGCAGLIAFYALVAIRGLRQFEVGGVTVCTCYASVGCETAGAVGVAGSACTGIG